MPDERQQFRVLYRDFLFRLVDVELLSSEGDVGKLLGQFGAMVAAFSLTITIVTFPALARSGLPFDKLIGAVRLEQEFLIATTMAIAGLFSVLAWNTVFPDRRDSLILGLLPVRVRTILLAKIAAIATAVAILVGALNLFTGLTFPFLAVAPNAGPIGGLRSFAAHWIIMAAAGLFVCAGLLALQGLAAHLLSHRLFLRVSSFLQLVAFFGNLGIYFLKPSFSVAAGPSLWPRLLPSLWFCGLLQILNGDSSPKFQALAVRAAWGLAIVIFVAAATLGLAYRRNIRRIIEQPDITPADRSRPASRVGGFLAAKLLSQPFDRAILLFIARTLSRSRQHRLLLAAYSGIGLAIALAYARELIYGTESLDRLYRSVKWNEVNGPFLVGSLVLLFFSVMGARAVFAMPTALRANWIFRITAVHSPWAYSAAVRKSLAALTALPVWLFATLSFFAIWPLPFAAEHAAILMVTGVLIVELALYRFRKIPFACSYLPGKARIHTRVGTFGVGFLFAAGLGVQLEYWAMQKNTRFVIFFGILLAAAFWAHWRSNEFSHSPANSLQFDDLPIADITALDLHSEGSWSRPEAYVDNPGATSVS